MGAVPGPGEGAGNTTTGSTKQCRHEPGRVRDFLHIQVAIGLVLGMFGRSGLTGRHGHEAGEQQAGRGQFGGRHFCARVRAKEEEGGRTKAKASLLGEDLLLSCLARDTYLPPVHFSTL